MRIKQLLILGLITALVTACNKDESKSNQSQDNFDRGAMLVNYADKLILPNFELFQKDLQVLVNAKDSFITAPTTAHFEAVQTAWGKAYNSWQYVEMYNIGKAEEILYNFQMNIYPTNTADIHKNIQSGAYDLSHPNNNDAVGFPALDYMLFGLANSQEDLLAKYTSDYDADKYKKMLSDLVDQMQDLTTSVNNDWKTNYRKTFIESTDNSASSAVNKFINDYIFYFEKGLRANKFGIPAGNFSNEPLPDRVEGLYHNTISKQLALEAIKASKEAFNGTAKGDTETGESFYTYLSYLGEKELADDINLKFDAAYEKVNLLSESLSEQVKTDNTKMTEAYDALQKIVILLKLDMLQAFNVRVDYVDADGD